MKWKTGFVISTVLLSALVMCHSGDDNDDEPHHAEKYRDAGPAAASMEMAAVN